MYQIILNAVYNGIDTLLAGWDLLSYPPGVMEIVPRLSPYISAINSIVPLDTYVDVVSWCVGFNLVLVASSAAYKFRK